MIALAVVSGFFLGRFFGGRKGERERRSWTAPGSRTVTGAVLYDWEREGWA